MSNGLEQQFGREIRCSNQPKVAPQEVKMYGPACEASIKAHPIAFENLNSTKSLEFRGTHDKQHWELRKKNVTKQNLAKVVYMRSPSPNEHKTKRKKHTLTHTIVRITSFCCFCPAKQTVSAYRWRAVNENHVPCIGMPEFCSPQSPHQPGMDMRNSE